MKKIIYLMAILLLLPQIVMAAWWNPFSWFNYWATETNIQESSNLLIDTKSLPKKSETTNTTSQKDIIPKINTDTQTKKTTAQCNPNYSGCLKVNSGDYDCSGGKGDGPNYTGAIRVIGYDQYGLDRDGDGRACEN